MILIIYLAFPFFFFFSILPYFSVLHQLKYNILTFSIPQKLVYAAGATIRGNTVFLTGSVTETFQE